MPASRPSKQAKSKKTPIRVGLVHWNSAEASKRAKALAELGFRVEHILFEPGAAKALRENPPSVLVIDLTRLPSHGRDVGLAIREQKGTRMIPLVFAGGLKEKVESVRRSLPDAFYANWETIGTAIRRAMTQPPKDPVIPKSRLDGYSGTPLPRKLGIKSGFRVDLVDAPPNLETELGELEAGATLRRRKLRSMVESPAKACDLALWFIHSRPELTVGAKLFAHHCPTGGVWFMWRKKAASGARPHMDSDDVSAIGERDIREIGLAAGLVDFKICAVNAVWSGLKFTIRKEDRAKRSAAGRQK